jgi:cyclopropane fatty-acyl-phospholipid synthase-like methyltransferase
MTPRRPARLAHLGLAALLTLAVTHSAVAQTPQTHEHSFSGAEQWARTFDDPARDQWQKPHQVLNALDLGSAKAIADIGAGTGYFATRLAHMAPQARIFAVDLEADMVKYLAERASREGVRNLIAVQATPTDPRLPGKVDRVLLVDVYHHIGQRVAWFQTLAQYLAPGGQVAIIDFRQDSPIGPPAAERAAPESIERELAQAGYRLTRQHDFLPNQVFLVFERR